MNVTLGGLSTTSSPNFLDLSNESHQQVSDLLAAVLAANAAAATNGAVGGGGGGTATTSEQQFQAAAAAAAAAISAATAAQVGDNRSQVGKVLKDLNVLAGKISPKSSGAGGIIGREDVDMMYVHIYII